MNLISIKDRLEMIEINRFKLYFRNNRIVLYIFTQQQCVFKLAWQLLRTTLLFMIRIQGFSFLSSSNYYGVKTVFIIQFMYIYACRYIEYEQCSSFSLRGFSLANFKLDESFYSPRHLRARSTPKGSCSRRGAHLHSTLRHSHYMYI